MLDGLRAAINFGSTIGLSTKDPKSMRPSAWRSTSDVNVRTSRFVGLQWRRSASVSLVRLLR